MGGEARREVTVKKTKAVLPGKHGLDCAFYQHLFYKTLPLRGEAYITFATGGAEFRPVDDEHAPSDELARYQKNALRSGAEESYGEARSLEVLFSCYCPAGSNAADRTLRTIQDALEEARGTAKCSAWDRSKIGFFYTAKILRALFSATAPCYRPPPDSLPHRTGPPEPAGQLQPTMLEGMVRARLEKWGMAEDYDLMRAEQRRLQRD